MIETVRGAISPQSLGKTLVHEHIMVDWIGADQTGPHRYDRDEVVSRMAPYLTGAAKAGYASFIDCSPAYLGRDPEVLVRLSEFTGLNIVTNTGFYKEPYIPSWAFDAPAEAIAAHWVAEAAEGVDGTGIKPGFIKIAVFPGELAPLQKKIVKAAGIACLETGLTIASHTGCGVAAMEQLAILSDLGVPAGKFIVVHADGIGDRVIHEILASRGVWLEYDSIGWRPVGEHLDLLAWAKSKTLLNRVLISHDAGWYNVGEPHGGSIRPYSAIDAEMTPEAQRTGILDEADIDRLLVENPKEAFEIGLD